MIVGLLSEPYLQRVLLRAAHAEEDVILDGLLVDEAIEWGSPRLVVRDDGSTRPIFGAEHIPVLQITNAMLSRWEDERRSHEVPPRRLDYLTGRVASLVEKRAENSNWVDRALADLSRAAGTPLPPPLRGFARRILEFPSRYTDLHAMSVLCGVTRGALKARFRRRGLASPYVYLRWFRMMAAAAVLSDRSVTVVTAANHLGFTSDGNLCRSMGQLTNLTPTEARSIHGWNRLLIEFAWEHLTPEAVAAWSSFDDLFGRVAA